MKTNDELTRLGRLRRAKKIIESGMSNYDLNIKTLTFLAEETNIFYKIVTTDGVKYAVKLYEEISSNLDDSIAEIFFLNLVNDQTDISVPKPIKNSSGDSVTLVDTPYDDHQKRIAVYSWMDGKDLSGHESAEKFQEIGVMMAKLHVVATKLKRPKHINPKRINKVLYYAGDEFFYKKTKHKDKLTPRYFKVMDKMIPYLDQQLSNLYQEEPIMIHGDFNPWNLKISGRHLNLLDFEDTSLGYPIHDVAILFFYHINDEHYDVYKDAFYKGYRSVRPIEKPDADILEMLIIARHVNFLNYILEVSEDPSEYIDRNLKLVETYMKKKNLI